MNGHPFIPRRWFFENPDRVAALLAAVGKRQNTPWAENSRAPGPGGGYDCENYVEDVMLEVGVIDAPFEFPRSDSDFRSHVHNSKFLNYLRGKVPDDPRSAKLVSIFAELDIDQLVPVAAWPDSPVRNTGLIPGDLLIIKSHVPGVWHMPMMIDDRNFTQCASPDGVSQADVTQGDYRSRLKAAFRARAK